MPDIPSLIIDAITQQDVNRPRSLQREVGPSDLGDPCDHCLAAKLAGWEKKQELQWLPYIGTAVHAQLAQAFHVDVERFQGDWLTDCETLVGHVDGKPVYGTADLFHVPTQTVIDFKICGITTIRKARAEGPSVQYQRQAQLYARGLYAKRVGILYLPRGTNNFLRDLYYWEDEYRPDVAHATIDRATVLSLKLSLAREDADAYISSLPRVEGCYDCPRYPDWEATPAITGTLQSLIGE